MLANALAKIGLEITTGIRDGLIKNNRVASGSALNSLRFDVQVTPTLGTLQVWGASYIYNLEYGRGPTRNREGGVFTPQVIEKWIIAKSIQPTGITLKSLAYLIWRKINRDGYKGTIGVISETINPQNVANWLQYIGGEVTKTIEKEVRDAITA